MLAQKDNTGAEEADRELHSQANGSRLAAKKWKGRRGCLECGKNRQPKETRPDIVLTEEEKRGDNGVDTLWCLDERKCSWAPGA